MVARDALDVFDLLDRARDVDVREFRGELGLEDDYRQRVSQHIVKVPRDALAFGDLSQMLNLLLSLCEFLSGSMLLAVIEVDGSDHNGNQTDINREGRR